MFTFDDERLGRKSSLCHLNLSLVLPLTPRLSGLQVVLFPRSGKQVLHGLNVLNFPSVNQKEAGCVEHPFIAHGFPGIQAAK